MLHKCRKFSCTYSKNLDFFVKCMKHASYTSTSKYRWNLRAWHPLAWQSVKVFSVKIVFFTNSQKFSPSKVSRYAVVELWLLLVPIFFDLKLYRRTMSSHCTRKCYTLVNSWLRAGSVPWLNSALICRVLWMKDPHDICTQNVASEFRYNYSLAISCVA